MKKVKRNKILRETSYVGRGGNPREIIPPQKIPLWLTVKARIFAKQYGVSAKEYLEGIRTGEYPMPENPNKPTSGGIPMPDITGISAGAPDEPPGCPPCTIERAKELETKRIAAATVRGAAPPMRPRLGGQKQEQEPSPFSQVPSNIPNELKQFALEFKDLKDKAKLAKVIEKLAKESDKFGTLAMVAPELLGEKVGGTQVLGRIIGGKSIDMDFIADLVLGDKKAIESLFKTIIIPTKKEKLFNALVRLIGQEEIKKFFLSEEEYKKFIKNLNENKNYIKLASILF